MKNNTMFQLCNLLALVVIISITTIGTTAQMSRQPENRIGGDTTRQKYSLNSFTAHVQADGNNQKLILTVSNPFGENLRIAITGNASQGFSDKTSELTYRKRINMMDAEDGVYADRKQRQQDVYQADHPDGYR